MKTNDELLSVTFPWILLERYFYTDKIYGGYVHAPYMQKKFGIVFPVLKGSTSWRILYFRGKNAMYVLRWTGFKIFSRWRKKKNISYGQY